MEVARIRVLLNDIFRVYTLIFVAWWAQMKEFQVHDYFGYFWKCPPYLHMNNLV
jgi:hypothetical protein